MEAVASVIAAARYRLSAKRILIGFMSAKPTSITVAQAREALRNANLRSTTSRVTVLQHLALANKPLSHAEVADALVPEGYDKSTLYRCLVELAEAGLLTRFDSGDHSWRFEIRRSQEHGKGEHPHFVCIDCGTVSCLPDVQVMLGSIKTGKPAKMTGITEIFLKGHCDKCSG